MSKDLSLKSIKKDVSNFKKTCKQFQKSISSYVDVIEEEYKKEMNLKISCIIESICNGENLNKDDIFNKYVKITDNDKTNDLEENKVVYDKFILDGISYYKSDSKNGSIILDLNGNECGKYENGKYLFYK
jgi:hypothetical protein